MAHKFVKLGISFFFVLSVSMIITQSDDFFEGITGNVIFFENDSSENVSVDINKSTEEVIVILRTPSEEKFFGMIDKSDEEIDEEMKTVREEVIKDFSVNDTVKFSSGGFAAEVNESVLKKLGEDSRVIYIEPVRFFSVSLSEVVAILNVSEVWMMNISGQNLTGAGQTVCVIDTGVNYSHNDSQLFS